MKRVFLLINYIVIYKIGQGKFICLKKVIPFTYIKILIDR